MVQPKGGGGLDNDADRLLTLGFEAEMGAHFSTCQHQASELEEKRPRLRILMSNILAFHLENDKLCQILGMSPDTFQCL
jgi:hypothetical protein